MRIRQTPSIARNLTISLVATAVLVIIVGTAVFTAYIVDKEKTDLVHSSDEIADLAAQSLSLPVWYLHADSIKEIGQAYAVNALVVGLRIQDTDGRELFAYSDPNLAEHDIRRQREIMHEEQVVGRLDMVVSVKHLEASTNRLLLFGGMACLLVSMALFILTGFWLRVFLSRPVERLGSLVENYSGGEMPPLTDFVVPKEFVGFEKTLRSMASRIHRQVDELALAESRYRSLFENALEGMFRTSVDGRMLTANPAMASMLGYDSPESFLESIQDVGVDLYEDPAEREAILEELDKHGFIEGREAVFLKKDGERIWVNLGASYIRGESLIQGQCQDVTRQIEAREALIAAKEAAENANKLKTDFLSMVSHELRTPLASIVGFSKLIDKRLQQHVIPKLEEPTGKFGETVLQVQDQLDIIVKEGERLTRLINNVLDLAKLEAKRMPISREECDIREIVETALTTSQTLFDEKGLSSAMLIPSGLPPTVCDRDRILQVLINLISNSVRFMDRGTITCKAESTGTYVIVSVEDQGPGIHPDQAQYVFEKFYQLGDTVQSPQSGSGLGLAICHELVEHHGGKIWYENLCPNGCAFRFTLPVSQR